MKWLQKSEGIRECLVTEMALAPLPWWTLWLLWSLTCEMLPPSKIRAVLQAGSHVDLKTKGRNNLPGGPGRPGRPGKPPLPGRPVDPVVVRPGFPRSPFRPRAPLGPRAPGPPGRISPHKNVSHISLLFKESNWCHMLDSNSKEEFGKAFVSLLQLS